jgi:hypothetical protein
MIDSAQLVDSDMNISFIRLLWKYVCVAMVAGEVALLLAVTELRDCRIMEWILDTAGCLAQDPYFMRQISFVTSAACVGCLFDGVR